MLSLADFANLASILEKNRDRKPPEEPPVACRRCGKVPKVKFAMSAYHPCYIDDNCQGIYAGASYGGAIYHWNRDNQK